MYRINNNEFNTTNDIMCYIGASVCEICNSGKDTIRIKSYNETSSGMEANMCWSNNIGFFEVVSFVMMFSNYVCGYGNFDIRLFFPLCDGAEKDEDEIAPKPGEPTKNSKEFEKITEEMRCLYERKNHDYGDSFSRGCKEIGISYAIGRIYDKTSRLVTLTKSKAKVEEKTEDTLIDLANYAVMTLMCLKNVKK